MVARGVEYKIMDICAAMKINAMILLKEAVVAVSLGKEWPHESPHNEELA